MPVLTHPVPDISPADAGEILATHWKLQGTVRPLPGERERNFHVYTADDREFVLKVTSPLEDAAALDLQAAALAHVAAEMPSVPVPRPVPAADGSRIAHHVIGGEGHAARLLTWLQGRPLAEVSPQEPALLRAIGESLGSLARALSSFEHPAARRALKWDLGAPGWIAGYIDRVADATRRAQITRILEDFNGVVGPVLRATRSSVVHNDANDHNLLVALDSDGAMAPSGIIDFGDLLLSHPACDLAIAIAYAMMGKPDPLTAAAHVVAGYHASYPLTEGEIALLFPLARTRLAVSLVNSALQSDTSPDNTYLQISADGAGRLLDQLDGTHERLAEYRFRHACGLGPCPASVPVADWLTKNTGQFAPLLAAKLNADNTHVHDFSVTSGTIGSIDDWRDQRRFSLVVDAELAAAGNRVGIGRYDEVRAIYTTDLFRVEGNDGPEWRTVHLGIDVGAASGTPIHVPLAGKVHSLHDNDAPGDYGPTIVLEHAATGSRPAF